MYFLVIEKKTLLKKKKEKKRLHYLNTLSTPQIILSHEQECMAHKLIRFFPYCQLFSNHREADTKVIAHTMKVLWVKLLLWVHKLSRT